MLEFKKYNSIENSFSREFMEKVVAEMPADLVASFVQCVDDAVHPCELKLSVLRLE